MDQLIFASLSHTHYWYEVGMLKVPYTLLIYEGVCYTYYFMNMLCHVRCMGSSTPMFKYSIHVYIYYIPGIYIYIYLVFFFFCSIVRTANIYKERG